jgi:predicted dehydrogenase
MINAAIIGVSGYGKVLYGLFSEKEKQKKLNWSAAVIRTPSKAGDVYDSLKEKNCSIFQSADEMLETMKGKLDLVIIPTGIGTHCPFTLKALESGADVLVEKPVAGTVKEVERMIEAENSSSNSVSVGFQDIYRQEVRTVKQKLVNNEFGKVKAVKVAISSPRPENYYERNNWAGKLKAGDAVINDSPANNACAHHLNLAMFFAGSEFEKSSGIKKAETDLFRAQNIESFDTISMRAETFNGTTLCYNVTHSGAEEQFFLFEIECEKCKIIFDYFKEFYAVDEDNREIFRIPSSIIRGRENMAEKILARIENKNEFTCSLAIAGEHTRAIEKIHNEAEIRQIPDKFIRNVLLKEKTHRTIMGIEQGILEAHKTGRILSELDLPWL